MEQKCALEKQILQNTLSLSSIAPDEIMIPNNEDARLHRRYNSRNYSFDQMRPD